MGLTAIVSSRSIAFVVDLTRLRNVRVDRRSKSGWATTKDIDILVREHPTYDLAGNNTFPSGTLDAVKADIEELISMGRRVIVVDSGGCTRTGMVWKHMGAKEDFSIKA